MKKVEELYNFDPAERVDLALYESDSTDQQASQIFNAIKDDIFCIRLRQLMWKDFCAQTWVVVVGKSCGKRSAVTIDVFEYSILSSTINTSKSSSFLCWLIKWFMFAYCVYTYVVKAPIIWSLMWRPLSKTVEYVKYCAQPQWRYTSVAQLWTCIDIVSILARSLLAEAQMNWLRAWDKLACSGRKELTRNCMLLWRSPEDHFLLPGIIK